MGWSKLFSIIGSGIWALFPLNFYETWPGHYDTCFGYSDRGATRNILGSLESIKLIDAIFLFSNFLN